MMVPALGAEIGFSEIGLRARELQVVNRDLRPLLEKMARFASHEEQLVANPRDRTRVHIQVNEQGEILKGRPCAILIHGLFNSPVTMAAFETSAFNRGAHVISLRLPGHHEIDPTNLDHVSGGDWLRAVDEAYGWAHALSDEIVIAGHSTGGLLALMAAAKHPNVIKHALVLAPALGLSPLNSILARTMASLGLTGADYDRILRIPASPEQDYQSSFAAREVLRLGSQFRNSFSEIATLVQIDVHWFDTVIDDSVDLSVNDVVSGQLGMGSRRVVFDRQLVVKHEDLTRLSGTSGQVVQGQWLAFFGPSLN